jgi:hypothetical protein
LGDVKSQIGIKTRALTSNPGKNNSSTLSNGPFQPSSSSNRTGYDKRVVAQKLRVRRVRRMSDVRLQSERVGASNSDGDVRKNKERCWAFQSSVRSVFRSPLLSFSPPGLGIHSCISHDATRLVAAYRQRPASAGPACVCCFRSCLGCTLHHTAPTSGEDGERKERKTNRQLRHYIILMECPSLHVFYHFY